METGFAKKSVYFFVLFRLCSCASIHSGDTSITGTVSARSGRLTTFGVDFFTSGDYETETNYRVSTRAASAQPGIHPAMASEQPTLHPSATTAMNRTKNESNPCLDSHQTFCISGTCQYHTELKSISCKCHPGFEGERCHSVSMELRRRTKAFDLTTVVVPVVLSISCLAVFILLLVIRHQINHKKEHEECEEKAHLQMAPVP